MRITIRGCFLLLPLLLHTQGASVGEGIIKKIGKKCTFIIIFFCFRNLVVNINWNFPIQDLIISDKDKVLPNLQNAKKVW